MHVYTRPENGYFPECAVQRESNLSDPKIARHIVSMARTSNRYRRSAEDTSFAELLDAIRLHVIHIGHLKYFYSAVYLRDNEEIIGSTMSATCGRDFPVYGIDVGWSPTSIVASTGDYPTDATRSRRSTLEPDPPS